MTDTPRTLAELQTLLADNTTGNISAQDVRDFLVTAVKLPEDGMFLASRAHASGGLTKIYNIGNASTEQAQGELPNGGFYTFDLTMQSGDLGSFFDPAGYLITTTYDDTLGYWGVVHPANTVLLLPEGVYTWTMQTVIAGSPDADSAVFQTIDAADAYYDSPNPLVAAGLYAEWTMNIFSAANFGTSYYAGGPITVPSGETQHFVWDIYTSGWPSTPQLRYASVFIVKDR